jgi:hypothetical protein
MEITAVNRRPATTLTEVLIAIFIMAIGLMALLTLFPIGALQMAQSLKDQRCAEVGANAIAYARANWKAAVEAETANGSPLFYDAVTNNQPRAATARCYMAMDDPNLDPESVASPTPSPQPKYQPLSTANGFRSIMAALTPTTSGPSYPVFYDPMGYYANQGTSQKYWVGVGRLPNGTLRTDNSTPPMPSSMIPRRSLNYPNSAGPAATVLRPLTLTDDLTFNTAGQASGTPLERQDRYNFGLMFRRGNNTEPFRGNMDVTVVIYSGRSIDVPAAEYTYTNVDFGRGPFNPGTNINGQLVGVGYDLTQCTNTVSITYGTNDGPKPAIRRGSWILDSSLIDGAAPTGSQFQPQGFFYRVVDVISDDGTTMTLELQTTLKPGPQRGRKPGAGVKDFGTITVMDKVVEVFEKGPIDLESPPRPY